MIMSGRDAAVMRLPAIFCMLVLIACASRASSSAATCPAGAIQSGLTCCSGPPACKQCGGAECANQPGKAERCCALHITTACGPGVPPPCRMAPQGVHAAEAKLLAASGAAGAGALRIAVPEQKACVHVPEAWERSCSMQSGGGVQSRNGEQVVMPSVYGGSSRWGNALSPYWQARGMAFLGGIRFHNPSYMGEHWLKHLPQDVPPPPPGTGGCAELWKEACHFCSREPDDWMFSHKCVGAWNYIAADIAADTRAALVKWGAERGLQLPQLRPGDVVIQDRCAQDTFMSHREYGPMAFSFYDSVPADASRIIVVGDAPITRSVSICSRKNASLFSRLAARSPAAELLYQSGDAFTDFAFLVYAPILYKEASSFGLWAAMANTGTVWSAPLWRPPPENNATFGLPNWHWSPAPVMYPDIGTAAGIKDSGMVNEILSWLETH